MSSANKKNDGQSRGGFLSVSFPDYTSKNFLGKILIGVVLVAIIAALWFTLFPNRVPSLLWFGASREPAPGTAEFTEEATRSLSPTPGTRVALGNGYSATYVYYIGDQFVPSAVTIDGGDSVRFVNATNLTMRVGSRPENLSSVPYSSITQARAEGRGSTYEVSFSTPGIWSYENLSSQQPRVLGVVYVR